jgi:hypothetical protein
MSLRWPASLQRFGEPRGTINPVSSGAIRRTFPFCFPARVVPSHRIPAIAMKRPLLERISG